MKNANQPALPCDEYDVDFGHWEGRYEIQKQFLGLTKRELFAAMAMQGMMSVESTAWNESMGLIAGQAIAMADALLDELERTEAS